ncbi:MAG: hypothetical protein K0S25_488 [Bacillus sp. (in: firmicutes)]|jgi:hypothetical protein|nr:hypothetical protein [Bacillus sp. (in: firmicutes)]
MAILDSGARRDFGTGAVRDVAEGKGRCDLMPLDVVGTLIESPIIESIDEYVRKGKIGSLLDAILLFIACEFPDRFTAMIELSKHYEDGCKKYGDRNWEKGIPLHCYIDSATRHLLKYYRGDKDENHHLAFIWNLSCAIWTHNHKPELIDLPFKDTGN